MQTKRPLTVEESPLLFTRSGLPMPGLSVDASPDERLRAQKKASKSWKKKREYLAASPDAQKFDGVDRHKISGAVIQVQLVCGG